MESAQGLQDTALAAAQEPWNFGQLVQQGQPGQSKDPPVLLPTTWLKDKHPHGDKPPAQGVALTQAKR